MTSVNSLSQLQVYTEKMFGLPLFIPVDEEFVRSVHSVASPSLTSQLSGRNCAFYTMYRELFERNRLINSQVPPGIPNLIFSYAADAVISSRGGEFMGPLCSPIRKTHAKVFQSNQYFVTEKSDGTRVVFLSISADQFPCWVFSNDGETARTSMRLDDVISLEEARLHLHNVNASEGGSFKVKLSCGSFRMKCLAEQSSDDVAELFVLEPCVESPSDFVNEVGRLKIKRSLGDRHMAYCFDRSVERAYLLMEEYAIPSISSYALDGELMVALNGMTKGDVQLILGCFDVFRYTQLEGGNVQDVLLTRCPMSKRYAILKERIILPLESSRRSAVSKPMLYLFAKDMLPLERFGECVLCLRRDENIDSKGNLVHSYYYDGPYGLSKSDGFIFTPEIFNLVHGASKVQFKWKWPTMLSVDWGLMANEKKSGEYTVDIFFRKKRFGHRPDSVGRVRLSPSMPLLNPFSLEIPTTRSAVAECVFDFRQGCWSIERLRTDKCEPNSVITVISVLESLVENITLQVLAKIIGISEEKLPLEHIQLLQSGQYGSKEGVINRSFPPPHEKKTCQLTLRATQLQTQGEHDIHLYWSVRLLHEKQHIPCIHCRVSECTGLGLSCPAEDERSKLTEHLYIALANAGGSYAWSDVTVEANFDGVTGRWNIVSLSPNGENRQSTCIGVIEHLQWLLMFGCEENHPAIQATGNSFFFENTGEFSDARVQRTNIHYACKTKELSAGKSRSSLRQFNNWIKSVLISTTVLYVKSQQGEGFPHKNIAVADLCSGRGGDLFKWRAQNPRFLLMADACLEAVSEAAGRYCVSKGLSLKVVPKKEDPGVPAHFTVCDVFGDSQKMALKFNEISRNYLQGDLLDVVSCQFSLHYGCTSEERVSGFLQSVSNALHPGGVFVGTTVHDAEILRRAREEGPVFGNSVYNVRFSSDVPHEVSFGIEYFISFEKSVNELPEYVVPWEQFLILCRSFNLHLVESFGFTEYKEMHYNSPLGQELRNTNGGGGKRDSDGHVLLQLSKDEEEAAALFRTFLFVKN